MLSFYFIIHVYVWMGGNEKRILVWHQFDFDVVLKHSFKEKMDHTTLGNETQARSFSFGKGGKA